MRPSWRRLKPINFLVLGILAMATLIGAHSVRAQGAVSPRFIAFVGINVVDTSSGRVARNRTLLVRDDLIEKLGMRNRVAIPLGALIIDGRGKYVAPGLVDVHVHFTKDSESTNKQIARTLLSHGVTTVLALHGRESHLALRDAIQRGDEIGPRIFVSTRNINQKDMTYDQGVALVDSAVTAGYDFAKVYDQLSAEGFRGVTDEARRRGLPVTGHIPKSVGLDGFLAAGLTRLAHVEELLYVPPFSFTYDGTVPEAALDPAKIPGVVRRLHKAGLMLSPTLIAFETIVHGAEAPKAIREEGAGHSPVAGSIPEWAQFVDKDYNASRFPTEAHRHRLRAALAMQRAIVSEAHRQGVKIVAGTDSPMFGYMEVGQALVDELIDYVAVGLSPLEALRTATINAGPYLNHPGEVGSILVGGKADLILLSANPVADIRALLRPAGVMSHGRWFDRGDLARLRNGTYVADATVAAAANQHAN